MSGRCRPISSTWCPESFVGAFAAGDVLQVLVLALLCGIGLLLLGEKAAPLRTGLERITELVFSVVHVVVALAPIGAFGAMAFTVAKFGAATLYALALLVGTAWAMMAFFIFVILGTICRLVGIRLMDLLRLLRTELLVVLGTSSSETAIPGMMEKLPKAGVGRAVAGLVIPSGYSFNLDGVALTLPLSHHLRRPGLRRRAHDRAAAEPVRGDAVHQQGRGRRHRRRVRSARRDRRRRRAAGGGTGAAARHRPLHVAGPRHHQHHRQRGRRHRGREMGRRIQFARTGLSPPRKSSKQSKDPRLQYGYQHQELPVIALTPGDCTGIGPEQIARILADDRLADVARLVVVGDARVLEMGMAHAGVKLEGRARSPRPKAANWARGAVPLVDLGNTDPSRIPLGKANAESGRLTGETLSRAIDFAKAGEVDAITFAPLNKRAMFDGGWKFPDEHKMFAQPARP